MNKFPLIQQIISMIAGLSCVVFALYFANEQNLLGTVAASLIAAFLLAMANLDRIAKGKFSTKGVEFKTREFLSKARDVLQELRKLAALTAEANLSLIQRAGRLGGYSDDERETMKSRILKLLTDLDVSDADIERVMNEWHRFVEFDYTNYILGGHRILRDVPAGQRARYEELRSGGLKNIATPDDIELFFTDADILTPQRQELLADYRHYIKSRRHRRPEVWSERLNWYGLH